METQYSMVDSGDTQNVSFYSTEASSKYYYYGHPTVEIFCSLLTLIMVTSVVGNLLVIVTILNHKHMRTRTNLLLCNLAICDILVGSVDVPFAIIALVNGDWVFSQALCTFNGYMVGLGVMLTIHTLMWISVHKYISIRDIFKQGLTLSQVFGMIAAAWIWVLLYNTLTVLGWTSLEFKRGSSQCGPDVPRTGMQISHSAINKTFNFLVPVCVICYCYTKIFTGVRNHLNNLQDFSTVGIKITLLKQKEISSTLLTVVLVFFACYSPYIAYSGSLVFLGEKAVPPIFNPLAYLFMYLNSACNPLIYALKFPSFRKAFTVLLCGSKAAKAQSMKQPAPPILRVRKQPGYFDPAKRPQVDFVPPRHSIPQIEIGLAEETTKLSPSHTDQVSSLSPRSSFLSSFRKSLRRTKSLPGVCKPLSPLSKNYGTQSVKGKRRPKRINTMPANPKKSPRLPVFHRPSDFDIESSIPISRVLPSPIDDTDPTSFINDMVSDNLSDGSHEGSFNDVFYEIQLEQDLESPSRKTSTRVKKISMSEPNLIFSGEMDTINPTSPESSKLSKLQIPWTDRSGSEGKIKDIEMMQTNTNERIRKISGNRRKGDTLRPWTMSFDKIEDSENGSIGSPDSGNRISRMFNDFKRSFNDLFSDSFDEDEDIPIPESTYKKYSLQPPSSNRESQFLMGHI